MRVQIPRIAVQLLAACLLAALIGCTAAPKYRGHGRTRPAAADRRAERTESEEPIAIVFSPPVAQWSRGRVTSLFGLRRDPRHHTQEFHHGIDIRAAEGEAALAAASGAVTFAGRQRGFGNLVVIDHGNRISTAYAHLARLSVRKGEWIARGGIVGTIGRSGNATSLHLHFEIRKAGRAVDPLDYL